jgi:hypothetical protein
MTTARLYPERPLSLTLTLAAGLLGSPAASALDRYVDALAGVDAGVCDNALAPCQTIAYTISQSLAGDTVHLVSLAGGPITFFESGLNIPFDLAIVGDGPLDTEIDAQGLGRIFSITANLVAIDGVTLRNGDAGFTNGGAIELLSGDLLLTRARLLDNQALAGGAIAAGPGSGAVRLFATTAQGNLGTANGGAIWCDTCGGVDVVLSRVIENVTGGLGGGVYAMGTDVLASFSSLSRNNADSGGAVYANFADVQILDSDVSGNEADASNGGAVFIGGTLNIERSTLAENSAANEGGAVYLSGDGVFVSANSTYSHNTALCGGGLSLFANFGAGFDVIVGTSTFFHNESTFPGCAEHIFGSWDTFELYNSIVANDLGGGIPFDPYCSAPLDDGQHNLIDDASCDTGVATFNLGQVTGLDFNLAYNGGPTRTHLLDPTSNAVDAGRNAACRNPASGASLVLDQRRLTRPVDFDANGTAECDIGSVELQ